MKNFSISESFSQAWHLLGKNIMLIALCFICSIPEILSSGFNHDILGAGGIDTIDPEELTHEIVDSLMGIGLLMYVAQCILELGFYNAVLTVVKGGKAKFTAYKAPADTYVKWVFADFIVSVIVCIGLCFCIIPGIYLAIKLMFVPFILLDNPECGFTEAFQRSWNMTKGNSWNLFGFILASICVVILGFICCCVGFYFTVPLATLAGAVIYMTLKPEEETITIEEA